MPPFRSAGPVLLIVPLLTATGCGVFKSSTSQASSESSSDSSRASSHSSSSSSHDDASAAAYSRDVAAHTERAVRAGVDARHLREQLGGVAEAHGVTDWEGDPAMWEGIGRGLAEAQVGRKPLDAWVRTLATGAPERQAWLRAGYDAAVR